MIDVYFNEHDEFKYDLTFYICEHYFIMQIFNNNDELREHVLHYHDFDIRFIDVKNKFKNCKNFFAFNNLLHNHLHECHTFKRFNNIDSSRRDCIDSWRKLQTLHNRNIDFKLNFLFVFREHTITQH